MDTPASPDALCMPMNAAAKLLTKRALLPVEDRDTITCTTESPAPCLKPDRSSKPISQTSIFREDSCKRRFHYALFSQPCLRAGQEAGDGMHPDLLPPESFLGTRAPVYDSSGTLPLRGSDKLPMALPIRRPHHQHHLISFLFISDASHAAWYRLHAACIIFLSLV